MSILFTEGQFKSAKGIALDTKNLTCPLKVYKRLEPHITVINSMLDRLIRYVLITMILYNSMFGGSSELNWLMMNTLQYLYFYKSLKLVLPPVYS